MKPRLSDVWLAVFAGLLAVVFLSVPVEAQAQDEAQLWLSAGVRFRPVPGRVAGGGM